MKSINAYTDGSCLGNPGPGGWAVLLRYKNNEKELVGGELDTTNNRNGADGCDYGSGAVE